MKPEPPTFPHDLSYDATYDADDVNGELFPTNDDLTPVVLPKPASLSPSTITL